MQPAQPTSAPQPIWQRLVFGRNPRRTLIRAAVLAGVCFVVFKFLLLPIRIHGISMEPAYRDGGINLVNRLSYLWRKPKRGDVVAVKTSGLHIMYLKRVIALPGESVAIEKGVVVIDGKPLAEPYVKRREPWELAPVKLEPDHYLVIGDNRGMDQRLHWFDAIPLNKIAGKVFW